MERLHPRRAIVSVIMALINWKKLFSLKYYLSRKLKKCSLEYLLSEWFEAAGTGNFFRFQTFVGLKLKMLYSVSTYSFVCFQNVLHQRTWTVGLKSSELLFLHLLLEVCRGLIRSFSLGIRSRQTVLEVSPRSDLLLRSVKVPGMWQQEAGRCPQLAFQMKWVSTSCSFCLCWGVVYSGAPHPLPSLTF